MKNRSHIHWWANAVGALLTAMLGVLLLSTPFGDGAVRWSYDLLFAWRPITQPNEAVVVYFDLASYKELHQELKGTIDRSLYARLVERLTADKAKAVVFDVVFSDPEPAEKHETDVKLIQAIQKQGRVILAGDYAASVHSSGTPVRIDKPWEGFRAVAADWGVANFPIDSDMAIRQQYASSDELQSLAWAAAKAVGAKATQNASLKSANLWINYYGPSGVIPGVSFHQALYPDGVAPGFFRDKVVFIGQKLSTDLPRKLKDDFGTGYTWLTKEFTPGVEIHATAFLNLLRQEWLTRFPRVLEMLCVALAGLGFGFGLASVRPLMAAILAVVGIALVATVSWVLFRFQLVWFASLIIAIQIGAALFWSIGQNSLRLFVEKRVLQQSLEFHLSPSRVRQLLDNSDLLKPGGKEQEISILFSDIADFSEHSQTYKPEDLFNLLNQYYDAALGGVHAHDGTVVQLIGDAILAVWNAPVAQPDHRTRACLAAIDLQRQLDMFDKRQRALPMRTRVGVHAGTATVGNLGSELHFNYATIGESVNLASRLEGLNKHLRTNVLATREIQSAAEKKLVSRKVGWFKFKGFGDAVEVYELIGPMDEKLEAVSHGWRNAFDEALTDFCRRRFVAAKDKFEQTITLRRKIDRSSMADDETPPEDGPSRFYLDKIDDLKKQTLPDNWKGVIEMKEK